MSLQITLEYPKPPSPNGDTDGQSCRTVEGPQKSASLTEEARALFIRVKEECGDVSITRQDILCRRIIIRPLKCCKNTRKS